MSSENKLDKAKSKWELNEILHSFFSICYSNGCEAQRGKLREIVNCGTTWQIGQAEDKTGGMGPSQFTGCCIDPEQMAREQISHLLP